MPELYMLTEHSPFMMSFVFITDKNRAVLVDGGNKEDMPYLKEVVGKRKIAAWILTHPHYDHISGFCEEAEQGELVGRAEKIYYNFPSSRFVLSCEPEITPCSILDFERALPAFAEKTVIVKPGLTVKVDELCFDFLFCGEEKFRAPKKNLAVNESSIAFKVTSPGMRSVLFLGDLGPEGGRALLRDCGANALRADIVQMAHHGHSGVGLDVYRAINPTCCLWCCPDWLWDEADVELEPDLFGTRRTRKWMQELGVKEHYVTKDGTARIPLS